MYCSRFIQIFSLQLNLRSLCIQFKEFNFRVMHNIWQKTRRGPSNAKYFRNKIKYFQFLGCFLTFDHLYILSKYNTMKLDHRWAGTWNGGVEIAIPIPIWWPADEFNRKLIRTFFSIYIAPFEFELTSKNNNSNVNMHSNGRYLYIRCYVYLIADIKYTEINTNESLMLVKQDKCIELIFK
jgi:hypothetical protein